MKTKQRFFNQRKRAEERKLEATHSKIEVTSLRGHHARLISEQRQTGFCLKCFVFKWDEAALTASLQGNTIQEQLSRAFITQNHSKSYNVERPSECVHHLLCLNCHPVAPGPFCGKMATEHINHQHKLRTNLSPRATMPYVSTGKEFKLNNRVSVFLPASSSSLSGPAGSQKQNCTPTSPL